MLILPTVKLNIFKTSFIQKSNHIYHNLGYWFMLLMVLAFIGFYTSYLSVIFQPAIPIIHLHFILMTLWMLMLIAQPFLIKYKKLSIHRIIGKISYGLVPLVLLSGFLMIRFSYYRDINQLRQDAAQGLNHFSNYQILQVLRNTWVCLLSAFSGSYCFTHLPFLTDENLLFMQG